MCAVERRPTCGGPVTVLEQSTGGEVVTVQEIEVVPGKEEAFLARFRAIDVLRLAADAAGGGLIDAQLVRSGSRFVVVTTWSSPHGIEAWIASPARELVRGELERFYISPPVVGRYAVRGCLGCSAP